MSVQEPTADAKETDVSNPLKEVLSNKPNETEPQLYRACLSYFREHAVELETVLTILHSLRVSLGSHCLQEPEDGLQVGLIVSELCQYNHTLIHAPAPEGDTSTLVECVQVLYFTLTEGLSLLHSYHKTVNESSGAILSTVHHCLQMMDTGFFSPRWLQMAGTQTFSTVAGHLRGLLKEYMIPLISMACDSNCQGNNEVGSSGFFKELQLVFHDLLLLGVKCAHAIAGTEEALSAKEFRSFGTLNAIWGALIKLVVGVPPAITRALFDLEHQPAADSDEHFFSNLIHSLTANTLFEFQKLVDWPQANQLQVFRFWLQALMKVMATFLDVVLLHVKELIQLGCQMYNLVAEARDALDSSDPNLSSAIVNAVKRYVACILEHADGATTGSKLFDMLMTELIAASEAPSFLIKGRLQLALDLLSRAPFLQGDCWLHSLKHFLPWMVMASKQQYYDFMDDSQMQLQLHGCFITYTYCLGRLPSEDKAVFLREFQHFLLTMALDLHPLVQQLLLHILLSIMMVEPGLIEEYIHLLAQLAHRLGVLAQFGDNHLIDRLYDNAVQLAGQTLRNAPQHVMDRVSVEVLQGCSQCENPLAKFAGLRCAGRIFAVAYNAQLSPGIQEILHSHLRLIINSTFSLVTDGCHQDFVSSLLCIEELLQAVGGNQVHQQERERMQELLDTTLTSPTDASVTKIVFYIVSSCKELRDSICIEKALTVATNLADQTEITAACAAIAQYSLATSDVSSKLFSDLFQACHWALRFETCQSLVQFGRSPDSGNFRRMIPDSLLENTECGEAPLMIQLKQHIQRKYFQSDLPIRAAAESAAEESIMLTKSSKEVPLAICRLVANTVALAERHCLEEADNGADVFARTQVALKGLIAFMDECGVQLLGDSRFEQVHGQVADVLVRMQTLKGSTTSDPQENHVLVANDTAGL
eukprot:jgi/Botrbrau1/7629/Bobra.0159s0077.1